jgi:hypothetical protein
MGQQVHVIDPQTTSNTLEGPTCEDHHAAKLVSTAKTIMLPASDHHWRQDEQATRSQYLLLAIRRSIRQGHR